MELSLEELKKVKDALGEEDRLMVEHEITWLTGRRYNNGRISNTRGARNRVIPEFGERAALELFSKLGRFLVEHGYRGSGSGD